MLHASLGQLERTRPATPMPSWSYAIGELRLQQLTVRAMHAGEVQALRGRHVRRPDVREDADCSKPDSSAELLHAQRAADQQPLLNYTEYRVSWNKQCYIGSVYMPLYALSQ
jgi:hypothetical protein